MAQIPESPEINFDDIASIRSDEKHPLHGAFERGELTDRFNAAYQKKYGFGDPDEKYRPAETAESRRYKEQYGTARTDEFFPEIEQARQDAQGGDDVPPDVQATFSEVDRLEIDQGLDPRDVDKAIAGMGLKAFGGDEKRFHQFIIDNDLPHNPGRLADARQLLLKWAREEK
jgi:hypothetical protein